MAASPAPRISLNAVVVNHVKSVAEKQSAGKWVVTEWGAVASQCAFHLAKHHLSPNRKEQLSDAIRIVSQRAHQARGHVERRYLNQQTANCVTAVGGTAQAAGGGILLLAAAPVGVLAAPVAVPIGIVLTVAAGVTTTAAGSAKALQQGRDTRLVNMAIQNMFSGHDTNDLLQAVHLLIRLGESGMHANQQVTAMQWIDTIFSYYLEDPERLPPNADGARTDMQNMLNKIVDAHGKGFFNQLSEEVQRLMKCKDQGGQATAWAEETARKYNHQALAAGGYAVLALGFQWAASEGLEMSASSRLHAAAPALQVSGACLSIAIGVFQVYCAYSSWCVEAEAREAALMEVGDVEASVVHTLNNADSMKPTEEESL